MTKPPTQACAVCGRVLDWLEAPDGRSGYVHADQLFSGQEHVPVPTDLGQIVLHLHCDFCFADDLQELYTIPAEAFSMANPIDPSIVHNMSSLWLACASCADLIKRRRWTQLTARVITAHEQLRPSRTASEAILRKRSIEDLYERLQAHLTGPPRLSIPDDFALDE